MLERKELEIVKGELKNIKEVKVDENSLELDPNKFLFDISSK